MSRVHVPKRIRLGFPQKPHGKRAWRPLSYQKEWLRAREATSAAKAFAAHREQVRAIEAEPALSFVEMVAKRIRVAELSMLFHVETSMFWGIDLSEMPTEPPQ